MGWSHSKKIDNRWAQKTTFWRPYDMTRPLGRPKTRWRDDLKKVEEATGTKWYRWAHDRDKFKEIIKTSIFEAQQPPPRRGPPRKVKNQDKERPN